MTTALVTGANRGIGLELTRLLVSRGFDVIATCRTSTAALDATGARVESGVDVGDPTSVANLASRLEDESIDLLVNNAGILLPDTLDDPHFDEILLQFQVNAVGPLRVTHALLDHLHAGSKVALVTSRMGSIADNGSGRMYGYRMSKAALNAAGMSLARDLASREIAVVILHPGYVATDMTNHGGDVAPTDAAAGLLARIDELTMETTGRFVHANGESLPW